MDRRAPVVLSNSGPGTVRVSFCVLALERDASSWEPVAWHSPNWACIMEGQRSSRTSQLPVATLARDGCVYHIVYVCVYRYVYVPGVGSCESVRQNCASSPAALARTSASQGATGGVPQSSLERALGWGAESF